MVTLSKKTLPSLALSLMLLIDSVRIFVWAEMPARLFGSLAKDLLPCQWTNETASLHQSGLLYVQFNFSYCPTASNTSAWSSDHFNAFRIHVALDATSTVAATSWPITFFVKEQNTGSSLSFSVPTQPEGFSLPFFDVSQTLYMCPAKHKNISLISEHPLVYIHAFTTSEEPLGYLVMIEPARDFILDFGETYSAVISPSSPQVFYFKIPDNVDIVSVEVTSDSENGRCVIVSVMNIDISCPPVNDLLRNARNEGIRQTMTTLAFLTFQASQVQNREVLLMIVALNDTVCHPHRDSISNDTYFEQEMMITIEELKPTSEYWIAILLPVVIILLVIYPFVFVVVFGCFPKAHLVPVCQLKKPCECVCPCPCVGSDSDSEEEESTSLLMHGDNTNDNNDDAGNHLIMSEKSSSLTALPSVEHSQTKGIEEEKTKDGDLQSTDANENVQKHLKDEDGLMRMTSRDYNQLSSQYSMYGWTTIIVGIFYALPILQFVLSEQMFIYTGGDQDSCFYNYKCVHPLGIINTFNGVWSNIALLLLGFLFMLVVTVRRWIYLEKRDSDKHYIDSHGVPQLFGVYYGLGFALIFQGLLSSFYHFCPNGSNYGFDIAFHFVMGGLLLVKIFQNRHPDVHTNSFTIFFATAIIIFFSSYGTDFSQKYPLAFRLSLFAIFLLLLAVFLVSLYHLHCWKWALHLLTNPRTAIREFFRKGPRHRVLLIKLLIAFIVNVILVVLVICLYITIDVARAILILFLFNVFFFVSMYFLSKLWYREPLTWLALVLPFVIVVVWGGALYFLVGTPSRQDLSPAESRELSKECTLLGFYDNHDIWHFLAAFGLFFSFLFVLVLDDGVADVQRENLHIF